MKQIMDSKQDKGCCECGRLFEVGESFQIIESRCDYYESTMTWQCVNGCRR